MRTSRLTSSASTVFLLPLILVACSFGSAPPPIREDVLRVRIENQLDQVLDVSYRYDGEVRGESLVRVGAGRREETFIRIRGTGVRFLAINEAGRQVHFRHVDWNELEPIDPRTGRLVEIVISS